VPGVGRKLAARVVLELKEKVAAAGVAAGAAAGGGAAGGESEVVAALLALGYSAAEARQASREALMDLTAGSRLEDRVKAALRTLLKA
jgi:Holliday junction DNA helicase RuvA